MKCDACKGDFSIWTELFWNGLWFYREVALKSREGGKTMLERVRRVMVCDDCLQRGPEYQPGTEDQGRWVT